MADSKKETRNTKQKKLIIDCLKNYGCSHMTVEEIYNFIKQHDNKISIATVYRNVKLLEEQGVVKKIFVADDTSSFYELNENDFPHSHHHLVCQQCGSIIDFEEDLLEAVEKMIEVTKDFTIKDHRVAFLGICSKCKAENRLRQEREAQEESSRQKQDTTL